MFLRWTLPFVSDTVIYIYIHIGRTTGTRPIASAYRVFVAAVDRAPCLFDCVGPRTASLRVWLDRVPRLSMSSWTARITSLTAYRVRRPRAASFGLVAYCVLRLLDFAGQRAASFGLGRDRVQRGTRPWTACALGNHYESR